MIITGSICEKSPHHCGRKKHEKIYVNENKSQYKGKQLFLINNTSCEKSPHFYAGCDTTSIVASVIGFLTYGEADLSASDFAQIGTETAKVRKRNSFRHVVDEICKDNDIFRDIYIFK